MFGLKLKKLSKIFCKFSETKHNWELLFMIAIFLLNIILIEFNLLCSLYFIHIRIHQCFISPIKKCFILLLIVMLPWKSLWVLKCIWKLYFILFIVAALGKIWTRDIGELMGKWFIGWCCMCKSIGHSVDLLLICSRIACESLSLAIV